MPSFEKNKEENWKFFVTTVFFIVACLLLSFFFPSKSEIQNLIGNLFFLVIAPILYIKFVLKEKINQFGLNLKNKKEGFLWGSLMLILSCVAMYLLMTKTIFLSNYEVLVSMTKDFSIFLLMILIFFNFILFIQEYFFHGFVLSFFSLYVGKWAILIQFGIYFLTIFIFKQNLWIFSPSLILSLTGGITAYKTQSMVYSYLSGLLFLIFFNAYLVYLAKI